MRPDLTGQGHGKLYLESVVNFAKQTFQPTIYRATIAQFNKRALNVCQKIGFAVVQNFRRETDGQIFIILMKQA